MSFTCSHNDNNDVHSVDSTTTTIGSLQVSHAFPSLSFTNVQDDDNSTEFVRHVQPRQNGIGPKVGWRLRRTRHSCSN
jgi:hypothetical protein